MNDRESPTVSLIVLNWNGQEYLEACMTSLLDLDYPDPEIVMVDNGSTDNSVPYVSDQFPSVRIIETGRNLGYAGGMNVGISRTSSDIVVLLNNDIIVEENWLTELVRCMKSDERIGIAGCKIFYCRITTAIENRTTVNMTLWRMCSTLPGRPWRFAGPCWINWPVWMRISFPYTSRTWISASGPERRAGESSTHQSPALCTWNRRLWFAIATRICCASIKAE